MTNEELKGTLAMHIRWLEDNSQGQWVDLSKAKTEGRE